MSNATPGPWKWVGFYLEGPSAEEVISGDEVIVSNPDDARLIAAAPELLEALKEIASYEPNGIDSGSLSEDIREMRTIARAAIAKAEGK